MEELLLVQRAIGVSIPHTSRGKWPALTNLGSRESVSMSLASWGILAGLGIAMSALVYAAKVRGFPMPDSSEHAG